MQNILLNRNNRIWVKMNEQKENPILFFDDYCTLCSGAVNFILKKEKGSYYNFASFHSKKAKIILPEEFLTEPTASIVVFDNSRFYIQSEATLQIARHLRFPWNTLLLFKIFPIKLRDTIYEWVARNRYNWFGKRKSCLLPDPKYKKRFME